MRRRFSSRRRSGGRKWFFILLVLAAAGVGAWFYSRPGSAEREGTAVTERSRGSSTLRTVELPPPQAIGNRAGSPQGGLPKAEKRGDGVLRQTREPVLRRLPILEPAQSMQWSGGGFGDPTAPGPSLYWLDVLVEMDDSLSSKARALNDLSDASLPADLHPVIAERLPTGTWQTSPALDRMFSDGPWKTRAWLAKTGPHLLLMVEGQ